MWVAERWRADKTGKKVARAEERLEETRMKTRARPLAIFPPGWESGGSKRRKRERQTAASTWRWESKGGSAAGRVVCVIAF